jgi:hypothetical protein
MNNKRKFAALLLLSVAGLVWSGVVTAQETASIKLQPAVIEDKVDPGSTFASSIRVTNTNSVAKTYAFRVRDIARMGDDGLPVFAEETVAEYGMQTWVRLESESVELAPGETREIPFVVNVPGSASPGGHFAGIFLVAEPEKRENTGAAIGYEVGTLVHLRVSGDVIDDVRIREFKTDRSVFKKPEVLFTAKVQNAGNILVRPRGPIDIVDMFGRKVDTIIVNDAAAAVFPNGERQFETSWQLERFAIGRYQATLALAYGEEGSKTLSASVSFWVLPTNIIVPALIGLLVLVVVIVGSIKLYVRRRMRDVQGTRDANFGRAPLSRLTFVTVATILFTILFLIVLFALFG